MASVDRLDASSLVDDPPGGDFDDGADPIRDALLAGQDRDLEDLKDISSRVRWVKSSSVPLARFQVMKALAMMDEFTDWDKVRIRTELRRQFPNDRQVHAFKDPGARMRKTKTYKRVREKLLAARD